VVLQADYVEIELKKIKKSSLLRHWKTSPN